MTLGRVVLFLAGLLTLFASHATAQERRIALVIGISAYQNAPRLNNPVNDARAIGDSLRRLSFDVTELYDPGFLALNSGVREFGIRAAGADVAVIYYAGHGVQVERENYLIPADARLERERDLLYEAMPLEHLLGEVSQASHVGIVLLDSCRNNPFIDRVSRSLTIAGRAVGASPGLARVDNVPRNTMVVMAAKADQIAEDGAEHSPFAAALLAHLQIPGLELSLFFRSVRDTVLRATNNRQEPYAFSSLGAEPFYFYPRPPNRPPTIAAVTALDVTDAAGPTPLGMPQPTDPDQDPLTVRVIGLPRTGEIRIDGKLAAINTVVAADHLKTATYKPDGKSLGAAGTFDILVEDGRGGSVTASLPVSVRSSHHPPVLGGPNRVAVAQQPLGIPAPVSPDGDTLTVTINALPRGTVRNGTSILHAGDRITPEELSRLTFWPESGFAGHAGALRYSVDNGHGGIVEGATEVDVGATPATSDMSVEALLWNSLQGSTNPAEFAAFLRLFPQSSHAADAAARQSRLLAALARDSARPATDTPASDRPQTSQMAAGPPQADRPAPTAPPPTGMSSGANTTVALVTPPRTLQSDAPAAAAPMALAANRPAAPSQPGAPGAAPGGGSARTSPPTFQDCPTCPAMVRIPPGSFTMGQGSREPEAMPAHRVEVHAFAMGQAPVTVAQWKACLDAKACRFLPRMRVAEDLTPVHNLSWEDVGQYVAWLSATTGHPYRLPSEAEWEYAARAGTTTRYWWGESSGMALANCGDCGGTQDAYGPLPVNALAANPFGLYDMLGGVAQWTADCWFPNYRGAPADATPRDAKACEKRVLRGGSFRSGHDDITVTSRGNYDAAVRYLVNGFRVARDLE